MGGGWLERRSAEALALTRGITNKIEPTVFKERTFGGWGSPTRQNPSEQKRRNVWLRGGVTGVDPPRVDMHPDNCQESGNAPWPSGKYPRAQLRSAREASVSGSKKRRKTNKATAAYFIGHGHTPVYAVRPLEESQVSYQNLQSFRSLKMDSGRLASTGGCQTCSSRGA